MDQKLKKEHDERKIATDRIKKQHKYRMQYNAKILAECKILREQQKVWKTVATREKIP